MALMYEEFIRCKKCDNPDFVMRELLMFHKQIRPRQSKVEALDPWEKEIQYVCATCGTELDR
jgi:hypothetical protein